jgi:hypothetical protein
MEVLFNLQFCAACLGKRFLSIAPLFSLGQRYFLWRAGMPPR